MTLRDIIEAIKRRVPLLLGIMIGSVVVAAVLVLAQGKRYEADAQIVLTQPTALVSGVEAQATQNKLILEVVTFARIITAPDFARDAATERNIDPGDVSVTTDVPLNTRVVDIKVSSSSQTTAPIVTQAIIERLNKLLDDSQASISADQRMTFSQIQRPIVHPVSTSLLFAVVAALMAGLAIAVTVILLLEGR